MSDFRIEPVAGEDANIVRVFGDVDLQTSPQLWDALKKSLRDTTRLLVDLAGVTYIDSSGVAVLIQALKQSGRQKVALSLLDPSERVVAVLELAQLTQLFHVERGDS